MRQRQLSPQERQMFEDLLWAGKAPEVQQHIGKLVVIHQKRVLAVGTDQDALLHQAATEENCPEDELVVVAVPSPDIQEIPH
jgi:hypothetical protein